MKKNMMFSLALIVLLVVLVGAYFMGPKLFGKKSNTEYQAVFLSSGQVYFGKIANEASDTVRVTDVYYLQVSESLQQNGAAATTTTSTTANNSQTQLIKLGSEIHGPTDEMRINRSQILFIEDLKADGKVVTAIHEYQKTGSATTK